jgi:hypothetical protein
MGKPVIHWELLSKNPAKLSDFYEKVFDWKIQHIPEMNYRFVETGGRTLPSHATEMTAAYLHQSVVDTLAARRRANVSLAQKQKLAAVIHLCGLKRGETFVARGFRVTQGERCGTHSLQRYLIQIDVMKKRFARLAGN